MSTAAPSCESTAAPGPRPRASTVRRSVSGSAWALSSKVLHGAFLVGANMVLAPALSPGGMADFFLGYGVVLVVSFVGQLGFNTSVVRFVAGPLGRGEPAAARRALSLSLKVVTASSLAVGLATGLLLPAVARDVLASPGVAAAAWPFAAWTVLFSLNAFLAEAFRGFGNLRLASLFGGPLYNILFFFPVAALYAGPGFTLDGALAISLAASVAHLAVAGLLLRRTAVWHWAEIPAAAAEGQPVAGPTAAELVRQSVPVMGMWLALRFAAQLDLWLVGALCAKAAVAEYGAVTRWVWAIGMPMTVINSVLPPMIAEFHARGDLRGLERLLRTAALATTPMAAIALLAMWVGGPAILSLVYGPFYAAAAPLLTILCLGMLASVFVGAPLETLLMTGHQTVAMAINVFAVAYLAGVGYVAGSYGGATGVAWAAATGVAVRELLLWATVRRRLGIWTHCLGPATGLRQAADWLAVRRAAGDVAAAARAREVVAS